MQTVHPGQTYDLTGTFSAPGTLVALSGDPAAAIDIRGRATSDGTILLAGARQPQALGATLNDIGVFTNAGTLVVGGGQNAVAGASLRIRGELTNSGLLQAYAGITGGGGQIYIDSGATLTNEGLLRLEATVTAESLGGTLFDAGYLLNARTGIIDIHGALSNDQTGGLGAGASAAITGMLINDGLINIDDSTGVNGTTAAGTMSVTGVLQNAGSILVGDRNGYRYPVSNPAMLSVSGSLDNTGRITVTGGPSSFSNVAGGNGAKFDVSGTLTNQGSIQLKYGGAGGDYVAAGYGAQMVDSGTFNNIGAITLLGDNIGTGPTLAVAGVLTNTGTVREDPHGVINVSGTLNNESGFTAYGGTSYGEGFFYYYPGNGGSIVVTGVLYNTGTMTLDGGVSVAQTKYLYIFPELGLGAQMSIAGYMRNEGSLVILGGDGGAGTKTSYDLGRGAGVTIGGSGDLVNVGTIDIDQGQTSSLGIYGTGATLEVSGYFEALGRTFIYGGEGDSTGELYVTAKGTLFSAGLISGKGVLVNNGMIVGYFGTIALPNLVNDGTVGGDESIDITIDANITSDPGQAGVIQLVSDAVILNGAVSAQQSVVFQGTDNFLQLGAVASFAGILSGLANDDTIDFARQDVTSATTTGDTLAITLATGATQDLALAAPLTGLSLTLQSDSNGGTDLLFTTAPAT